MSNGAQAAVQAVNKAALETTNAAKKALEKMAVANTKLAKAANDAAANAVKAVTTETGNAAAVVAANAAAEAGNAAVVAGNAAIEAANSVAENLNVPEKLAEAVSAPEDPAVEKVFANMIKFSKFALLAILLVLSFINGHKEYIAEKPRKFMWDNFAVGLTSAIGISVIAYMRGRADLIPNLAFIAFFLFFAYNVFRELSGLNAASDDAKLSAGEAQQVKKLKKPVMIIVGVGLVILTAVAFKARVAHPSGFGALAKEAAIFALCTVVGEIVVAANHDEHAAAIFMVAVVNFAMFFGGHILLQYGGFYNHVFGAPGPAHDDVGEALHEE